MLRTLITVLFTMLAAGVACLVMIPVTWILRDIRPIYATARLILRAAFCVAGVRIERRGIDPWTIPPPCVFVCNHVSNLDPPLVFLVLPRVAIMGKAVVFRWPLFGHAFKLAEFIPVERGQPESRRRALEAGVDRLKRGISLLIYPEGTRTRDGALLPFRPGPFTMAIQAQAPVVPITLVGLREIMPKGQAAIRPGAVTLVFHEAIPTQGLTQDDREALLRRTRQAIESALGRETAEDSR